MTERSFEDIRRDFPVLEDKHDGKRLTYLDSAASAQMPKQVMEEVCDFVSHSYANIHRGLYPLSELSTNKYEEARQTVAKFIGVTDDPTVIFTRGTTESLNLLAYTWGEANITEGDSIALPVLEHHSNLVPWQQLALRKKAHLRWIEIKPDGTLDLDSLDQALAYHPKLVAFTWVSNVFGTINPVKEIAARAKAAGALVVLDGAQGVPHLKCDVKDFGVDFLAFSGHKMMAPTGIGALWGRRRLLEKMPAFQFGGSMINSVKRDKSSWDVLPNKFEAGTPNISGAIGLAAACRYLDSIGMERIHQHDNELMRYAIDKLNNLPGAEVLGPLDISQRCSVLSFYFRALHPHDIATLLGRSNVCVRAGHHCCQPLMREIGMMGTTRASMYVYNNTTDIDYLIEALKEAGEIFKDVNCANCPQRKVLVQTGHHAIMPCCPAQSNCVVGVQDADAKAMGNTFDACAPGYSMNCPSIIDVTTKKKK